MAHVSAGTLAPDADVWASDRAYAPLVQVLRLLPLDVRAYAAGVCPAWRAAAGDAALWHTLHFCSGVRCTLNDAVLAQLCKRAGAKLRELRLDASARVKVSAAGVVTALHEGGCTGLRRLTLPTPDCTDDWPLGKYRCMRVNAAQLAAACPALEHTACCVELARPEDVATACALLPGPLTLVVDNGRDVARAAVQLPAQVAALNLNSRDTPDTQLDAQCLAALAGALRDNVTLTSLDICDGVVLDAGASLLALGEALHGNTTLKFLNLDLYEISTAGVMTLCESLSRNATLTTLKLENMFFYDDGAVVLCKMLRSNANLTTLHLDNAGIGIVGGAALCDALSTNATLTTLGLPWSRISDAGIAALCATLRTHTSLTALDLSCSEFEEPGAADALRALLHDNVTLKKLVLDDNYIGDASAMVLAEALSTHSTLTSLVISGNGIGDEGAIALGGALHSNSTLTELLLSENPFHNAGAAALADGLRHNGTLTTLTLGKGYGGHDAVSGAAGKAALRNALRSNNTLTTLMLNNVNIVDDRG